MAPNAAAEAKKKGQNDLKKNIQMDEHKIDLGELQKRLGTDYNNGLTAAEVIRLQAQFGPNQLTPPKETHWIVLFIKEMTGFFSLLLWFGSGLCFVGYFLKKEVDNLWLGIVLATVVFVTGCFSFFQNRKSSDLMKSFANMLPPKVLVIRDGQTINEMALRLVPGDIVKIEAGNLIPADMRVIECSDNLVVDNSALTGESEPQKRKKEMTHEDPFETQNLCFFGTQVPEGSCTGVIVNTGDRTAMGRIASLAMSTDNEQTPINKELEHFIHVVSGIAVFLGVLFFIIGWAQGTDMITNLVFMIGIIVANVPEGLLATVTVCLTLTAGRMHTKMVLVKNLEGVETLGSTSCICSDKTGTLTQNIMTVAQIVYGGKNGFSIEECESSFSKAGSTYDKNSGSFKALCACATLCNVAKFDDRSKFKCDEDGNQIMDANGRPQPIQFFNMREQGDGSVIKEVAWKPVGNASEAAMIKFIQPLADVEVTRSKQPSETMIPFNSKNKYQVHVHVNDAFNNGGKTPEEIIANNKGNRMVYMKGAPERILTRCDKMMVDGKIVPMTETDRAHIDGLNYKLAENGLRVLAFCQAELDVKKFAPGYKYEADPDGFCTPNFPIGNLDMPSDGTTPVHPSSKEGMVYVGMMALIDPPRPAVPPAVSKCKTAGIKVVMVTGDHPVTAQAIAFKVGILWSKTVGDMEKENDRDSLSVGDPGWQDPQSAQAIVVPGHLIDVDMGVDKWDAILEHPQIVFARTSPQQKLIIVENFQRLGHIVAVTGDGVNDSPALKKADIGVAMGIMGSEVSKNAADMILLDDNFASIVAGVEEGRLIFDNLKKSIAYTLSSNIPEIAPFISFILFNIPLPLSTVLILGIDLGTDMVPAISFAYETAEADIMKRPPRNSKVDRLVTKKLIHFAYFQIGVIQAMAGFYVYMVVLNDYGYPPHILQGLGVGDYWGKQALYCRFSGGQFVNRDGEAAGGSLVPTATHRFWDRGDGGYVIDCEFPLKSFTGASGSPSGFSKDAKADSSKYGSGRIKTEKWTTIPIESILAVEAKGYYEYVPWRGRTSVFWQNKWESFDVFDDLDVTYGGNSDTLFFNTQPPGLYSLCLEDPALAQVTASDANGYGIMGSTEAQAQMDGFNPSSGTVTGCTATKMSGSSMYKEAKFCNGGLTDDASCASLDGNLHQVKWCTTDCETGCQNKQDATHNRVCQNIASRMIQKEALAHAQGSYFVSIIIVQWADLMICKTRWLSLRTQGMVNSTMNFGLFFETMLGAWMCYFPGFNQALGTRPLRFTHWLPALPWSALIFTYDECRKYLMRQTSPEMVDKHTGQVIRMKGWLERNTYY